MSPRLHRHLRIPSLLAVAGLTFAFGPGHGEAEERDRPEGGARTGGVETGEIARGPVTGLPYRGFLHPETSAKWFESADGRVLADYAAIVTSEEADLTPPERLFGRDLAARIAASRGDAGIREEVVNVTFRFRRQPVADAAARIRPAYDERIERLVAAAREATDPAVVAKRRDEAHGLLRAMRREILDAARPLCAADHDALAERLATIPGARVLGRSRILSTLTARLRIGDLASFADAAASAHEASRGSEETDPVHANLASVRIAGKRSAGLNSSQGTLGASSWWNAGYDGSSTTKVAILDTGVDSGHPALSAGVTDEAVFLTTAATDPYFDDDENSTDDIHSHGTHVAGISGSRDATYPGTAKGASLMNAKCGYLTTDGYGSLADPDIMEAGDWAADNGADVMNCSFGGDSSVTDGSAELALFFDAVAQNLSISVAIAAGNSGSGAGTVGVPGDGFNVVTVGNFDDKGNTTRSDDALAGSSSRGPLSDGRRKPDLSAPGTSITSARNTWETNNDFVSFSGTSMAAPHVAGAAALLLDLGTATAPEAVKAQLMNSVRHASPAPTSPDDDWGHGAMDLSAAYTARSSVWQGTIFSTGNPRFKLLDLGSLASGDRVTLAWSRAVTSNGAAAPTTYSSLVDVDLFLYDETTGNEVKKSVSTLDSVEMVELTSALTKPVAKIWRAGNAPSSGSQTGSGSIYAGLADASTTAPAVRTGPSLAAAVTSLPSPVGAGAAFAVSVRVTNNGDLPAQKSSVTLTLPAGYSFAVGQNATVSSLAETASGGTATATFNVVAPAAGTSGSKTFSAAASDASYGETWAASAATGAQTYDVTPPTGTITAAGGASWTSSRDVSLAIDASDAHTSVVEMQTYETTAGSRVPYATSASLTLSAGDGVKTVRARFHDAVGNASAEITDTIGLDQSAPTGTLRVNNGAAWTSSRSVTLDLSTSDSGSGVVEMRFSDDGANWSSWTAFAASSPWTLPDADGIRTVYSEFRDAVGNTASSSDQIGLDRTGPVGTFTIASGAAWTNTRTVTLSPSATDAGIGLGDMQFSNDGMTWSPWGAYGTSHLWTLLNADGPAVTVYGRFRDVAGNVSPTVTATIGLDRSRPTGTVTIEGGRSAVPSSRVALALSSSDETSGVADFRTSADGASWSAWTAATGTAVFDLAPGEGVRTAHVEWRDAAGNVSASAADDVIADFTAPTASMVLDGGSAYSGRWGAPQAVVTHDDASGSGVESFRSSTDDGATWTDWAPIGDGPFEIAPPEGASGASFAVRGETRDFAGNVSAAFEASIFRLRDDAANGTVARKLTGAAVEGEYDAFLVDAMAGDAVSVKLPRGVEADLIGPSGERWVTGRFPEDARKAGIQRFVVPATGTATLVIRADGTQDGPVDYRASFAVRLAKSPSIALLGVERTDTVEIFFSGASSRVLTGRVDGSTTGPASLFHPDGTETPSGLGRSRGSDRPDVLGPLALRGAGNYRLVLGIEPLSGSTTGTGRLVPAKLAKSVAE